MDAERAGKDGGVCIDGATCRTYDDLMNVIVDRLADDNARPLWAGPVTGWERSTRSSADCGPHLLPCEP